MRAIIAPRTRASASVTRYPLERARGLAPRASGRGARASVAARQASLSRRRVGRVADDHARTRRTLVNASSSATDGDGSGSSAGARLAAWWREATKIDKKKIASLGSAALLSYGFVSNVFYVSSLMLATYTAVKTTGASPLTSSLSMKTFASSYFGFWMIQNFLRPARFALSVAISPGTDRIVEFFRRYAPNNDKKWAFAITVFCINVVGTFAYMFAGFGLIVALTGVPLELSSFGGLLQAAKSAKTGAP